MHLLAQILAQFPQQCPLAFASIILQFQDVSIRNATENTQLRPTF